MEDTKSRTDMHRAVAEHEKALENDHRRPHLTTLRMSMTDRTEPCYSGASHLHRLLCGHIIHTEQVSLCGRNCTTPIMNSTAFACTLCERQKMIQSGQIRYRSSRLTELILPNFPPFHQSHIPVMMRARGCDIAVVTSSKHFFVPSTPEVIAAYRINDNRRLEGLIADVVDVAQDMGFSQPTINGVTDGLTTCVDHQHLWVNATYEQLAAVVLYLSAVRVGIEQPGMLDQLSMCFGASMKGMKQLLPAVSKLLIDTSARFAIADFMQTFERTYPAYQKHSKDLARLQLKLWRLVLDRCLFPFEFIATNWRHVVTSCIYAVTTVNDLYLDTEEISAAIGARSPSIDCEDMNTYLLSKIVDDKAYPIKAMNTKAWRRRKLEARSGRRVALDVVTAHPTPDPVIGLDRSFETVSLNEFLGASRHGQGRIEYSGSEFHDDDQFVSRRTVQRAFVAR